jgi:hypothetical protein
MGRRGRRHKQMLDDFKEKTRYWKLQEEALDRTLWRIHLGRGYGSVVRQTTRCINEHTLLELYFTSEMSITLK